MYQWFQIYFSISEEPLLKSNSATPGEFASKASPEEVATATVVVLQSTVPGVVLLSVTASEEEEGVIKHNWNKSYVLTFDHGRVLQIPT